MLVTNPFESLEDPLMTSTNSCGVKWSNGCVCDVRVCAVDGPIAPNEYLHGEYRRCGCIGADARRCTCKTWKREMHSMLTAHILRGAFVSTRFRGEFVATIELKRINNKTLFSFYFSWFHKHEHLLSLSLFSQRASWMEWNHKLIIWYRLVHLIRIKAKIKVNVRSRWK